MLGAGLDPIAAGAACAAFAVAYSSVKAALQPIPIGKHLYRPSNSSITWWLVGTVGELVFSPPGQFALRWVRRAAKERGTDKATLFCTGLGQRMLVLSHPEDLAYVYTTNGNNYVKHDLYAQLEPLLGKGLVTIRDESKHAAHRRMCAPAFAPGALRDMASRIMAPNWAQARTILDDLCDAQQQKQPQQSDRAIDTEDALLRPALSIIMEAGLRSSRTTDVKQMADVLREGFSALLYFLPWTCFQLVPNATERNFREATTFAAKAVRDAADAVKKLPAAERGRAVIDFLVAGNERGGAAAADKAAASPVATGNNWALGTSHSASVGETAPASPAAPTDAVVLSEQDLRDHGITFVFAGYDTTSTSLTWLTLLLAQHPEKQDALYEELCSAFARDVTPTPSEVAALPYLTACLQESMRLMPAVTDVVRTAKEDDVLPRTGIFVPKGVEVVMFHKLAQRDLTFWGPDADEFQPERWLDPSLKHRLQATPGAFCPFALGRRNCIGKEFAMHSMLLAAAVVFRGHRFALPPDAPPVEPVHTVVMKPKVPIKDLLSKRA